MINNLIDQQLLKTKELALYISKMLKNSNNESIIIGCRPHLQFDGYHLEKEKRKIYEI